MIAPRATLIIIVQCLCVLTGCAQPENNYKKIDEALPFSGCWLSENYHNGILNSKSPRETQAGSQSIVIPARTLQTTIMVYNFHEGMPMLFVKNNDNYEARSTDFRNSYPVEMLATDKLKIGDMIFVKTNCDPLLNYAGILEEILFRGKYTNGHADTIEFKNDGTLIGLGQYVSYAPYIDYYDAGLNIDLVDLTNAERPEPFGLESFGFKFNHDTLSLYKVKCITADETGKCVVIDFGELAYRLWKIR